MARNPRLKVVTDTDKPAAPKAPETLSEAVEASERALLLTIRRKIAKEIDGGVPPHTLAPLTRQLREIDKEIRLLDQRAEKEADDGVRPDEEWDAEAI